MELKRLIAHALKLWRERGDDFRVAQTLRILSDANRLLRLYKEGIQQAKEALEIYKRLGSTSEQVRSLQFLGRLLCDDNQLDAAEEAAHRAINLLSDKKDQVLVCECHTLLGSIYRSKGRAGKAIGHFEAALGIASPLSWHDQLFWTHHSLAELFLDEQQFNDAHAHIESAKLHVDNITHYLGCVMKLEARFWYHQGRFREAKSAALRAAGVFEELGDTRRLEACRTTLRKIEKAMNEPAASRKQDFSGELWENYDFLSPLTHRSKFWVPDAIHMLIQTRPGTVSSPTPGRARSPTILPPLPDTIIPCNHALCIPFNFVVPLLVICPIPFFLLSSAFASYVP